MFIVTNSNQTLWDLAYKYYGDYNAVSQLVLDNPGVLNFNDDIAPGLLIKITEYAAPVLPTSEISPPTDSFIPYYEIVGKNQSIWDLALELYGTYDAVEQLILDNPDVINFNDDIQAGDKIYVSQKPVQNKMVDYLTAKGYKPATAVTLISNWILTNGVWDDAGVWVDLDFWND